MSANSNDLTLCPICGRPAGLLSRNEGYISLGCDFCHLSRTVTVEEWDRASTGANRWFAFQPHEAERRKLSLPVEHDRRRPVERT